MFFFANKSIVMPLALILMFFSTKVLGEYPLLLGNQKKSLNGLAQLIMVAFSNSQNDVLNKFEIDSFVGKNRFLLTIYFSKMDDPSVVLARKNFARRFRQRFLRENMLLDIKSALFNGSLSLHTDGEGAYTMNLDGYFPKKQVLMEFDVRPVVEHNLPKKIEQPLENESIPVNYIEKEISLKISKNTFSNGVIFFHLGKTGGTFIRINLCSFFGVPICRTFEPHGNDKRNTLEGIKIDTKNLVSSGHVFLKDLIEHKKSNKPIIVYLRDPLKRTISFYRYAKYMVTFTDNIEMKASLAKFENINLNSVEAIKNVYSLNELSRFSPEGRDHKLETMTHEKLDEIVKYTLDNCAFVGDFDHMEDSLHKLNLYLGLSLDVDAIVNTKMNETPNTVEKITNPEVLKFFDEQLYWEKLFNEKVFAAQRWKYGTPVLKTPGARRESMTQYIMPEGFDPDKYLIDMGIETEVEARVGKDKWKKREAAMQHVIANSQQE